MNAIIMLDGAVKAATASYPAGLDEGEIFEYFCEEVLLKNYNLSFTDIEDANVDGNKDGGIDSVFIFVNGSLVTEGFDYSSYKSNVEIHVFVIQAKREEAFQEAVINNLNAHLPELFDLSATDATLSTLYNERVRAKFSLLRETVSALAGAFPHISIDIMYACRGGDPTPEMQEKGNKLATKIEKMFSDSAVRFNFYGANDLYNAARTQKDVTLTLTVHGSPINVGKAYVALCGLSDYNSFVADGKTIRERVFEFNIRDYEGGVSVNSEMALTLANNDGTDFWWYNNGVTIIAEKASHQNNALVLQNPIVVNGLQTSNEVFNYLTGDSVNSGDDRNILVRVIETTDQATRDRIIKATNSQTKIKASSLRATEEIQRKIEDFLKLKGLYYDRRKNYYKNKGMPADRIISIDRLSQAVASVMRQEPHVARARPGDLIKNDSTYAQLFNENLDLEVYDRAARLLLAVDAFIRKNRKALDPAHRNNLRFHTMMVLVWNLAGKKSVSAQDLVKLSPAAFTDDAVKAAYDWVSKRFASAVKNKGPGLEDTVAKDSAFTKQLRSQWKSAPKKA